MSRRISDDWLSMQQQMFCKYFVEELGNGTKAYSRAYPSSNQHSNKNSAHRLLKKSPIKKRIGDIMEENGFNPMSVDFELKKIIEQDQNLGAKLGGIKEFNKIKGRYKEKLPSISKKDLEKMSDEELDKLIWG